MSSRSAITRHSAAPREKHVTAPAAGVQSVVHVEAAANDDKPKTEFSIYGDPLFGMAIASAILFAVMAALMAVG